MRLSTSERFTVQAAFLSLLSACALATEPPFPSSAVRVVAPPQYALWWNMVETCADRTADMARVSWYSLPGQDSFRVWGTEFRGYTWRDPKRVLLADGVGTDGHLVRHEMLHAILGVGGHPALFFGDRCAGVVTCGTGCAVEAKLEAPPREARSIPVSGLEVSVRVVPNDPSQTLFGGWFAVVIEARNPYGEAVWVDLEPLSPGSPRAKTFGFDSGSDEYVWSDSLRMGFLPNQARRYAFDIYAPGSSWVDGERELRGFFNTNVTLPTNVRVAP